ncbi:MAG: T9SS type A sorting domain-containing protein [Bacteroidota bacterium]|nr:T9SS type A sorting domain-containing protein [Bacteroidota bacterium]
MRIKLRTHIGRGAICATTLSCFLLLTIKPTAASANDATHDYLFKEKKYSEEYPAKKKRRSSYKNSAVRIVPHLWKKEMFVISKNNNGKTLSFLLFDIEGQMMLNYDMNPNERKKISGLDKGVYVYNVFCEDEQIEMGKMTIK